MKAELKFDLDQPEDRDELKMAMQGSRAAYTLSQIGIEVFRPARKHGYSDITIQKLMEKIDAAFPDEDDGATELVSLLEKRFYEIISENNIALD